ncbi:hypothetical protein [Actinoplanes sp. GCM10030250]|uniref:hypothetical protein n=1 Tax=Actinoplanes sp. GCM10030250 TaxID=3273376 RepID=UPI003616C984
MIVVVTGPSAAGKTTWCRRHFPRNTVAEHIPAGDQIPGPGPAEQAAFWAGINSQRWLQAVRHERDSGLAVCDDDPMKLHYSWSLARIGELSRDHWQAEVDAHRQAVAAGRLGFADVVLISVPPEDELRRRREADQARSRRNFDLHIRLIEPLREWYRAVERAGAAHVIWELPATGLPAGPPAAPTGRSDVRTFDAVIRGLG